MVILAAGGGFVGQWLWPILQFAIGLGLVVFVHELGHFLGAKWAKIKVEEFALGFGRRLFGFRRGETDYRVNLLPLGGYVKMLGQDDFKPGEVGDPNDPRAWQNVPIHKRLVTLSGGVAMNLVFAAVVFVFVYLVGIRFPAPIVGGVARDFPAAEVALPEHVAAMMPPDKAHGLRAGDRILAINGTRVRTYEQVWMAGALSGRSETFTFTVARTIDGKEVTFDVTMQPKEMEDGDEGPRYAFGIMLPWSNVIEEPAPFGYAGPERFQAGDEVVAVDGSRLEHSWDVLPVLESLTGRAVDVTVRRGGRQVVVPVLPYLRDKAGKELLSILGMSPRVQIGQVDPRSPADRAGLKPGDVITDYADAGIPSHTELLEANQQLAGKPVRLRVLRDGRQQPLEITPRQRDGRALIGIGPLPEPAPVCVAAVAPGSPAEQAGLCEGAVITAVNDAPVTSWADLYNFLKGASEQDVMLSYRVGNDRRQGHVGVLTKEVFDPSQHLFVLMALETSAMESLMSPPVRGNPVQALLWSGRDTWDLVARTYLTLTRLAERRVSPKSLRGPVGIGEAYVRIARRDTMHVVYLTAMLSVIVAVINFLPLPALDGGHVLLLGIEKIRRRPLPLKVQAGFQIAGLVLFLGIFLALTWNDIARLLPKW